MLIETKALKIRPVQAEDEDAFIEMASDGSLGDIGFDRDCGGWMKNWIAEAEVLAAADDPAADYLAYTATLKETGIPVGSVGCSYYEEFQKIGITCFIGARYRGKGYATEAVKAYVEYFFRHYDVPELIATVRKENTPSWKVVEKAGFQLVGERMYKDINDEKEELYRFYSIRNMN